ncbi:MAG: hypothetical protein LBB88_09735 [Planctomycetaceae bacterium]|nr:hypothetical protein [Planctomycetaceae bacterium]
MSYVISFIDKLVSRIGDSVNPLLVLELRRQFNLVRHGIYFAILYGGLGLLFAIALFFPKQNILSFIDRLASTDLVGFTLIILLFQFWFFVTIIPFSLMFIPLRLKWYDPLIISAMNEKNFYWGLYQIGLYYMCKSFCLLFFWVVALYVTEIISFDLFFIFPIVWLIAIITGNILFSFSVIFRRSNIIVLAIMFTIFIPTIFFWIEIPTSLIFWTSRFLIASNKIEFISSWNWLPIFIIAFPVLFVVNLKIINFNLTSNKPKSRKLFISFLIYAAIIIVTIIMLFIFCDITI